MKSKPLIPSCLEFLLLFFLIFGPRLYGHPQYDTLSIVSLVVVLYSCGKARDFFREMGHYGLMFGALIVYSATIFASSTAHDPHFVLRAIRATVNFVAVYFVCRSVFERLGVEEGRARLIMLTKWCVFIHSLIMALQYFDSDIRQFVYDISGMSRRKETRVSGLTWSYNTLSLVTGFGLISVVVFLDRAKRFWSAFGSIVFILFMFFALMVAGRTAAYLCLSISFVGILFHVRRLSLVFRLAVVLGAVIALSLGVGAVLSNDIEQRLNDVTLRRLIEPIESVFVTGGIGGTEGEARFEQLWYDMWFFPSEADHFVFGDSRYGRSFDYNIPSDIGYVLQVFGIGIVGTGIMVCIYLFAIVRSLSFWRYDSKICFLLFSFALASMVLNLKEQVLLTRHGLGLFSLFCSILAVERREQWVANE